MARREKRNADFLDYVSILPGTPLHSPLALSRADFATPLDLGRLHQTK